MPIRGPTTLSNSGGGGGPPKFNRQVKLNLSITNGSRHGRSGTVPGLTPAQSAAAHVLAVQGPDHRLHRVVVHFHEAEAAGAAGLAIIEQCQRAHSAVVVCYTSAWVQPGGLEVRLARYAVTRDRKVRPMAKRFLYVCLGILALAAATHLGADNVRAQAGGDFVGITSNGTANELYAITLSGDCYRSDNAGYTWMYRGNVLAGTVEARGTSLGDVKSKFR